MYVVGTPFDDVLAALADLDRVLGLAGNDTLTSAVNGSRLTEGRHPHGKVGTACQRSQQSARNSCHHDAGIL